MLPQDLINALLGAFGTVVGFLLNALWQAVKDLQRDDKALSDKVSGIEKLVAGDYMRRDEFNMTSHAIFAKLDRIEEKLDKKMDK
jgi:hypothetical protein